MPNPYRAIGSTETSVTDADTSLEVRELVLPGFARAKTSLSLANQAVCRVTEPLVQVDQVVPQFASKAKDDDLAFRSPR